MKQIVKLTAFLMTAAVFGYGCGQSSVGSPAEVSAPAAEKTAKVSLSFAFPDEGVEKALISTATTHILVNVKQWAVDDTNAMTVANTDSASITKGTTNSATLDLLPTWTRICATQWKGDTNNMIGTAGSKKLETACTFGKLSTGSNTVALTMIRGEWTLTSSFSDVTKVALNRNVNDSYYDSSGGSHVADVYDGEPFEFNGPFDMPTQAVNNWGSIYQGMFNKGGEYQFLTNGGAAYNNSFTATNSQEPYLFIGAGEEVFTEVSGNGNGICDQYEICDKSLSGFFMGGFANKTVSGKLADEKNVISFRSYRSYDWAPGCSYDYMGYTCYEPVLISAKVETMIEDAAGANVTATIVDPCQVRFTGGNKIDGCGATPASVTFGTYSTYNAGSGYKVTSTFTVQGANICGGDGGAVKDAAGNLICVNHDYGSYQSSYTCNTLNMTYDSYNGRCEKSTQQACIDLGGSYDTGAGDCTVGATIYDGGDYYGSCNTSINGYGYADDWDGIRYNTCYDNNYTPVYTYDCWDGGTYNSTTGRCEMTLEEACAGSPEWPDYCPTCYDATTKTCTETEIGYLGSISFTPVTMNGVGSLPASTGVTASKTKQKNTIKW